MSWFTKYLDKPASMATDVVVATATGAAGYVILEVVMPAVPVLGGLAPIINAPLGGVIAAATYLRARTNLLDPAPAFKPGPS